MKFEVGEIAIIVPHHGECAPHLEKYFNTEVEVVSALKNDPDLVFGGGYYEVVGSDGHKYGATPSILRKKKPPEEFDWVKMCKLDKIDKREIA